MGDKNVRCDFCNDYFEENNILDTGYEWKACEDCADELIKCGCCSHLFLYEELRKDKIDGIYYCENCP
ncbi:hypothetical protein [Bacillus sp. UNC41MFS5]|uniref:hypothetical protein n=1 Tax=Bacillus sp. UNC41MFS5 TaxID=1449046 RepID=UPI00047DD276|nr:hypothetical protein [Bacillus sp. UNC41MFS5]